jgi:preprotein translocase subunit YajC
MPALGAGNSGVLAIGVPVHLEALMLQPAGPKAGTGDTTTSSPGAPAPQAGPGAAAGGGGSWITFLPILMILPVFFLMSRRNKKEAALRQNLKKGDQVVSQSGLVGELVEMDDRFAKVKIGPGVTVRMLASSLSPLDPTPATKEPEPKESAKKPEKAAAAAK